MRYWWVNQNKTHKSEVRGGFLWSPVRRKDGVANRFYDNMTLVRPGDLVFSFYDAQIQAVGTVIEPAQAARKPEFGSAGDLWQDDGWLVPVEFKKVPNPVRPKDLIAELRPHLPDRYSPLQDNGNGNQVVYLTEISEPFAEILLGATGANLDQVDAAATDEEVDAETELARIQERTDIGPTEKEQLVKARRGQGIFKANLRLHEQRCRVTGVDDVRFLVASHMKPWARCTDAEKLDGANGLLLSPHIDNLFDRGFISFSDSGELLLSPQMSQDVASRWGVQMRMVDQGFSERQLPYLKYHREWVFRGQ